MLIHTQCPIDDTDDSDEEVYPANFNLDHVTSEVFSARRMPDRMHYRMVRNTRTGCLRANPILDADTVFSLYRHSAVNQESIAPFTLKTYMEYFGRVLPYLPDKRGVLEIGCAGGHFLAQLMDVGFEMVQGFELSLSAIEHAEPRIRPHIMQQSLRTGLLAPETFSLACGFQVLDHLLSPNDTLRCCRELLIPGGLMYWICHDIRSPLARLLGKRCPMIDIEHVVLYDKQTISRLFARNGFEILDVFSVYNTYPLSYWAYLAPLPFKNVVLRLLDALGPGRWRIRANFGNMGIVARKPVANEV